MRRVLVGRTTFATAKLLVCVFFLLVCPVESHSVESGVVTASPAKKEKEDDHTLHVVSSGANPVLATSSSIEATPAKDFELADSALHDKPDDILGYYQQPHQLRGNQHRRLPGSPINWDFDSPESQSALIILLIVLLFCCCWGGRRGGCSLCDILACVCIYEMCCDNGGVNDFMSF